MGRVYIKPEPPSQYQYVISGVGADGRRTYDQVAAESAAAAVAQFTSRGYWDVTVHNDDLDRSLRAGRRAPQISARDTIRIQNASALGMRLMFLEKVALRWSPVILAGAALLTFRRVERLSFGWGDAVAIALLLMPTVHWLRAGRAGRLLRRINLANHRANWDRMLKLIPRLERALRSGPSRSITVKSLTAKALMAKGRREEALALMESLRAHPGVPADVYWINLAFVHSKAHDYEAMRSCYVKSTEANPLNPAGWIGLTHILAQHFHRPAEARAALEHVKQLAVKESVQHSVKVAEGVIALEEGDAETARIIFEKAIRREKKGVHGKHSAEAAKLVLGALLCLAYAKLGRMDDARASFKRAEPYLTLHKHADLLARCRRAVGAP
jgi:tetratricopeptide (TPR) repeat protein